MKKKLFNALAIVGLSVFGAAPASAELIFTLDQASTLGAGSYGTVTVQQVTTDEVNVAVDLASGVGFVNTGLEPFTFMLESSIPTLTAANFTNLTAGFALDTTSPVHNDGAGTFTYGLTCSAAVCGTGGNATFAGPLSFDLTATGLLETSFISNGTATFAVDICRDVMSNGQCAPGANTGVAYATSGGTTSGGGGTTTGGNVPEPGTLALIGLGLTIIAVGRRASSKRA